MDVMKGTDDQTIPHLKFLPTKKVLGHGVLVSCCGLSLRKLAKINEGLIGTYISNTATLLVPFGRFCREVVYQILT